MKKFVGCLALLFLAGCGTGSVDAPPVTAAIVGNRTDATRLAAGRNIFVHHCIECHALPRIREHAPAEWPAIVNKMSARADLTPAQHDALIAYILAVREHGG